MRLLPVLVILLAAMLCGCGYTGEPLPPALRRPVPVLDLRAVERGANIEVQFTVPLTTTEALAIQGQPDIELRIGTAGEGGFDVGAWQQTADLVPNVHAGSVEIPVGKFVGKTVIVGVNVHGPHGRTAGWSNFVTVPVVPPLAKPEGLEAKDAPDAVSLDWHAAAGEFRVYRKSVDGTIWELSATVPKPPYNDATIEYGKTYQYYLEAAEKTGETAALSEASAVITFKPVDKFAPAVPAGLVVVAGARGIELVWERNAENDFAGYRIYRNDVKLVDNLTAPSYSDQSVQAGTKYRYQLTAFDKAGNESAKSPVAETALP